MNLHRRQLRQRWLLALGVVAVFVHLLASPLMARAMAQVGHPGGLDRFAMALCTTPPHGAADATEAVDATTESASPAGHHHAATAEATQDHAPADHRCCDLCGACSAPAAPGHSAAPLPSAQAAGPAARSLDSGLLLRHAAHAPHAPRAPPGNV